MTKNKIDRVDEMTFTWAPWVEEIFKDKWKEQYKVSTDTIKKNLEHGVKDPALYIFPVQTDKVTGKQFKMVETISGKEVRVAVKPYNAPDEPLYTQEEINNIGKYILERKGHKLKKLRDYAYFIFSINTWRRAGDNLRLTIGDVINPDGSFKDWLIITSEQKTHKMTTTPINTAAINALKLYLDCRGEYKLTDYLFPANFNTNEPMTVDGMCIMLKRAAKAIGLTQKFGNHSLRKTGAYHYVLMAENKGEAEYEVSRIFGHSSISITRRYLMIERNTLASNFEERKLKVEFN